MMFYFKQQTIPPLITAYTCLKMSVPVMSECSVHIFGEINNNNNNSLLALDITVCEHTIQK